MKATRKISDIVIGRRIREDLGDIENMAATMKIVGQLRDVLISPDNKLIAGRRIIESAKLAGFDKVNVDIRKTNNPLLMELIENSHRKSYTIQELDEIKTQIEKIKQQQKTKKPGPKTQTIFEKGKRTVDIMSEITGEGRTNIQKKLDIAEKLKKEPEKYSSIVARVNKNQTSVSTAHRHMTREERAIPKVPLPDGIWGVVLADPPIGDWENKTINGAADNNYSTISVDELAKGIFWGKDIRKLFAENCIIHAFFPPSRSHHDGPMILKSWGFDVVTEITWDKMIPRTGYRVINMHENLLIGIKGHVPAPAVIPPSVIHAKPPNPKDHSKKPLEFYNLIEDEYPQQKYLELWGRMKFNENWTVYGDEVSKNPKYVSRYVFSYIKDAQSQLKKYGIEIDSSKIENEAADLFLQLSGPEKERAKRAVDSTLIKNGLVLKL